jgi:hypothetical protein
VFPPRLKLASGKRPLVAFSHIFIERALARTVLSPLLPGKALKLSVGVKISSALRTISHYTANFGPRFSAEVIPMLTFDRSILHVETECSSAIYKGHSASLSKHLTAIIRDSYIPMEGENIIICAALLERGHANTPPGVSAVEWAFQLDTEDKRIKFLDRCVYAPHHATRHSLDVIPDTSNLHVKLCCRLSFRMG